MDVNQELEQFKRLVTQYLTIHLSVLEANATLEEDISRIKETEQDLGQVVLNILHHYQIETADLESAVSDARNAATGENQALDLDAVMPRLKQEMSRILNTPVIEPFVENLRTYYRTIFRNPELAAINQELYEKCLNIILHPTLVNTNPVYLQDMKRLFKELLRHFLAEERRLISEEESNDSNTSYETVESSSDNNDKNEDDDNNEEKSVSFNDSKNEVIPDDDPK